MRLAAVAAAVGLVVLVPAVVSAGALPITSDPTSPLTNIDISADLNCTVNYQSDGSDEWFTEINPDTGVAEPDACGTFVAVPNTDGPTTIYGPAQIPGAPCLTDPSSCSDFSWRYEPYTPATTDVNGNPDNQVTSGTGTETDPYKITTTVLLGSSGLLKLVETDTYINGQNSYRTDVQLINTGADLSFSPVIYHAGDCFLQNQDAGFGSVQNGNAPICNDATSSRIEAMYPVGSGSNYLEGYFDCVWQGIESGTTFPDQKDAGATSSGDGCASQDPSGNPYDNALGLSWPVTLAPGDSSTVSALNVFSPGGAAPLTVTKTADKGAVRTRDTDGYTITVSNPGGQDETLDDITDNLPSTFSYVPGSSTVDGQPFDDSNVTQAPLDWHGPFTVPAASNGTPGTLTLHFGVTVGDTPGTFRNSASASGQDLTVNPADNAAPVTVSPTAVDDGVYTTRYETALTVNAASGVLANDVPNNGTTTVAGPLTGPAHGSVTLNADGSFTYTPAPGYSGPDSFTYDDVYRVPRSEQTLTSNVATVSLSVSAPPAPVAGNDTYSTPYETQLTITAPGLLGNDSASPDQPAPTVDTKTVSKPTHGTVSAHADGSFTYTPNAGFTGMDTFTYENVSGEQHSNQASVTVTVGPSPAPVAADDAYSTPYETVLTVTNPSTNLLANDTPPKDQTNTVDTVSIAGPSHGTVSVQPNGDFTYTPTNGYTGPDSFTYRDIANGVPSNTATVSISVGPFTAPVASSDNYDTPFGTSLVVPAPGLLQNDTGPKDQPLTVETSSVSGPAHGAVTVASDGSLTYTPNPGFTGPDTFTYKDVAGGVESNQATVVITVGPDLRPVAVDDGPYPVSRNVAKTVTAPGVLANDSNPSGDPLTAVLQSGPAHGTVTLGANGGFSYTPAAGYIGPDSFTYKASSGGTQSATAATVSLQVVDDAPIAESDSYTTPENATLTVPPAGVLQNDHDPNGDPLVAELVDGAHHGAVTLDANGGFRYSPVAGFAGSDTFTYRASDGTLSSQTATVTIDVAPLPVAADDAYSLDKNSTLHVGPDGVLGNDTPNNGSLSAQLDQAPTHGSLSLDANGGFVYTPNHGFSGTDTFTYRAVVGEESSAPATVTIQVVDQPPSAFNDSYSTAQDTALSVPAPGVLHNDTDPNGDALTAVKVADPHHGSVTLGGDGSFTYTPDAGFHGTDTFTYRASDGTLSSTPTTVTITVAPVASPPPTSSAPPSPTSSAPAPPPVSTTPAVEPPTTPQDTVPVSVPPTSVPPTSVPPTTSTTPPSSSSPPPTTRATLMLSSPSVNPGGQLTATGRGCVPGSPVLISVAGKPAGDGTADASGSFAIPASAPDLAVGTYPVVATCGNRQLTTEVALVFVVGASATPAAETLTVATLLAFFLLLLALIIRRPTGH